MNIEKIIENIIEKKLGIEVGDGESCHRNEFEIGESVFIRTVTYHHVGRVIGETPMFIMLEECSWVADSGRFNTALTTGELSEVEPMPGVVRVNKSSIVDVSRWSHELPEAIK